MLIDANEKFLPAAAFMEAAAMDLNETTRFLLESMHRASRLDVGHDGRVQNTIAVEALDPNLSIAFELPLHVIIDPLALVKTITKASRRHKLQLEGFQVVDCFFTQPRLVLLIRRRVVGQLFCSRDGQSLHLEIRERPDARDMGNAVLAIGRLWFNTHTPLGTAPADSIH
ncbi:hypothetical protein [Tardiphaga sp.]|uniref:hypothetical protein n=1 Tax=Tardiphaga sp. TaxID=1926292 RepID=UPI00352BAEF1